MASRRSSSFALSHASKSPDPQSSELRLWDAIYAQLLKGVFHVNRRKFLPYGLLDELLTPTAVDNALGFSFRKKPIVQFVLTDAKKIFATMLAVDSIRGKDLRDALRVFQRYHIHDDALPLKKSHAIFKFLKWGDKQTWIDYFRERQWYFLAPIISTAEKTYEQEYDYSHRIVMPFVTKAGDVSRGSFGQVYKYEVHERHFQDLAKLGIQHPKFLAVKELIPDYRYPQRLAKDWLTEVKALEKLKTRNHPHIVRFITAFRLNSREDATYFLVFEWADGGNLGKLWATRNQPKLSKPLVKEACQQILGLASALQTAHYFDGDNYIRHGDLKPENILWFTQGEGLGTLKIADWGLAKEHTEITILRSNPSASGWGTMRYRAPEIKVNHSHLGVDVPVNVRSRLCDVWAMGCITLEFLIWLLFGYDRLRHFKELFQSSEDPFFTIEYGTKVVSPLVRDWMAEISKHPSCREGSALRGLLDVIRDGLLVIELPPQKGNRPSDASFHTTTFSDQTNPDIPTSKIPEFKLTRVDTLKPPTGSFRYLASQFEDKMKAIVQDGVNQNDSYWCLPSESTRPMNIPMSFADYSRSLPAMAEGSGSSSLMAPNTSMVV